MAFEYFPVAAEQKVVEAPRPNWLLLVTLPLFIALVLAVGYIIWDKNNTIRLLRQNANGIVSPTPVAPVQTSGTAIKDSLQQALIEMTTRYELLKTITGNANHLIHDRDSSITAKSNYIKNLLANMHTGNADLIEAKRLIGVLNADIEIFKTQVETLKGEKIVLLREKQIAVLQATSSQQHYDSAVSVIRQQHDIIDVATTLNASGFNILSIHEKDNGSEVSTIVAKRVDKLRISFELGENHVASSGLKELFICITGPDGTPISVEALGSGKFINRSGDEKFYTQKAEINYVQGHRQTVSFDWRQNSIFESGVYKIEVYNNGFKIGEGTRVLKK